MSEFRGTRERAASPLAASFERLAEIEEELYLSARFGESPERDWVPLPRILEDRQFLREQLRLVREKWDLDNRNTAIGVVGRVVWHVGGAAIALYATERRVPNLSPENLSLRLTDGDLDGAAFLSGGFAAVSGDPARDEAVAVFEDEDGLAEWMRAGLEGLLEPLISGLHAETRVGRRVLWGRSADMISQRFLGMGKLLGDRIRLGEQAERFVKSPGSPLNGNTGFFTVEHQGRKAVFFTRGVCCQGYKYPGSGYCGSCLLLSREEREQRAVAELAG